MSEVQPAAISKPPDGTSPAPTPAPHDHWTAVERIAFRFAFVYLVLYCWPDAGRSSLLDAIPALGPGAANESDTQKLTKFLEAPVHTLCSWTAVHIFHLGGPVTRYHPTGSGDTTLDYIQVFCFAVIASVAALVWSLVDRRRAQYGTPYAWLRLLVRFTLAFTMLSYGFVKVFPLQFGTPALSQLTETYGESSPMGLLWTFMGASTPYTIFAGMAEATAGLLLLFRRTTALGALLAVGVLSNIVALNFCYDVPVKLYSSHLLAMALFLLIPELGALWGFFVLHRMSRPEGAWLPPFRRLRLRRAVVALQAFVIASVLYNNIWGDYKRTRQYAAFYKHPSLYGVWDVDSFSRNGSVANPPWHRMFIDAAGYLIVRTPEGGDTFFQTTYEESRYTVKLVNRRAKQEGAFTYSQPDKEDLQFSGTLNHEAVVIRFHSLHTKQFLLTTRGFNWINEDPFNR
jgi:hypothetical protein